MNQSLFRLYMNKSISLDNAFAYSRNVEELERMIEEKSEMVA
jgi:Tfp pilus assembly ATPase PilU